MTTFKQLIVNHVEYNSHSNRLYSDWLVTLDESFLSNLTPMNNILHKIQHITKAQLFWNSFLSGYNIDGYIWSEEIIDPKKEVDNLFKSSLEFESTCKKFTEEELIEKVHFKTPWADNCLQRIEYILHCVNHSTHDRGQISAMARLLGYQKDIPLTEYSFYLAGKKSYLQMKDNTLTFHSLSHCTNEEILTLFNTCFENYIIPIHLSLEQFELKLRIEDIDLNYSVGCSHHDLLVGFILHGRRKYNNKVVLFNGGTGVLPEYRGKSITEKMYQYLFNEMKSHSLPQINEVILDVIETNQRAYHIYQKIGFKKMDTLLCFKKTKDEKVLSPKLEIVENNHVILSNIDCNNFIDHKPHWQNDVLDKIKKFEKLKVYTIENKNEIQAFAIINDVSKRFYQLAVHKSYRRKGIGSMLINHLNNIHEVITMINISEKSNEVISFLKKNGCEVTLRQYHLSIKL